MIYPESFETRIGFDTIRAMVLRECRNEISSALASQFGFTDQPETIRTLTGEVEEYFRVLTEVYGYPDPVIPDMTALLESIRIPGTWFEPEELPDLHEALSGIARYISFFRGNHDYPYLDKLTHGVLVDPEAVEATGGLLDEQGNIRDKASPELARIRKEINAGRLRSERVLKKILKEAVANGIVPKETEFTVKNGRFVIPVPAARKRQLHGYVHDESGTGQTLYIEPGEVLEIFNELRELELAERREIIRILIQLADLLRPHLNDLKYAFHFAGRLDFIRARAKLAIITGGVRPELEERPLIQWMRAVHPLLFLTLREQGREVVPLDIHLEGDHRILVISGPNAGGKSVCLKTVGLLQYMWQCGLLIPVHPNSKAGIFSSLFIDIGDQQSLENDLSTYSSHLMNIRVLLENADNDTLFLIDEMGSGTEPNTGGAIAEAALEMAAPTGAFGVVTTHYANLKLLAGRVQGIQNGAMLFDTRNMQPLYKLRTGKPGSSFAFEIAAKTGMSGALLDRAREKVGEAHYEFDFQMQNLETEKEVLARKEEELRVADTFLAEMIEKYTMLYQKLESSKKELLQEARQEAKLIIDRSNSLIERTVKQIRESGASKEEVKQIRDGLKGSVEELLNPPPAISPPLPGAPEAIKLVEKNRKLKDKQQKPVKPMTQVKAGDFVSMKGHTKPGEVIRVSGSKVVVAFGGVTMKVDMAQLEWAERPAVSASGRAAYHSVIKEINEKSAKFKTDIDVRGLRGDEALSRVRILVDDAILLNVKDLRILHGKGDGILRQLIRDFLAGIQEVRSFQDEHIEHGGHGVTLVNLK
ncbi:MAG: Smr/MutS family protein [Bacteroidales bacterium]